MLIVMLDFCFGGKVKFDVVIIFMQSENDFSPTIGCMLER